MNPDKIAIFKSTEFFESLNETVLRSLVERAVERRVSRDEVLFLAGDEARGMFVIANGAIRAFRTGANGREQTIHVERAPATFAEVPVFDDGAYPSTAAAEEDSTLFFLEKSVVRQLCLEHPEIALGALKVLSGRLRRTAELIENLSLREVGQRLASFLLTAAREFGEEASGNDQIKLRFNLTHSQIAARIGTVREVATRVLLKFQNAGMIAFDKDCLIIKDKSALAAYAKELID